MNERDVSTERFEAERKRLYDLALRMLGSRSEADDAVQETWIRLHRTDPTSIKTHETPPSRCTTRERTWTER